MFEESLGGRTFYKSCDHVVKHGRNSIKSFIGLTNVVKSSVIMEDFLNDERGNCFRQFAPGFHDSEAEGDNFCGEEETDNFWVIDLDKSTNDPEGSETKIFEGTGLTCCVQERVEVEGDVGGEERGTGFFVGSNTLEKSKGVANSIGGMCLKLGRVKKRVDAHNLSKQHGNRSKRVPKNRSKIKDRLPPLTQVKKGIFTELRVQEIINKSMDFGDLLGGVLLRHFPHHHSSIALRGSSCMLVHCVLLLLLPLLFVGLVGVDVVGCHTGRVLGGVTQIAQDSKKTAVSENKLLWGKQQRGVVGKKTNLLG